MAKFSGFPIQTLMFLDKLEKNNNRDWFNKHKDQYESDVRTPALDFINAMADPIKKLSPHFRVEAKKVGGSLMRVYRDTRFSSDKTPYKTNVGIQFRHEKGKDVHASGFYFHIDTEQVFLGAGIWHPDSPTLQKIRQQINKRQADWKKIISSKTLTKNWAQEGDSLKRPPRGYDADHPLIEEIKRKDFILVARLDHDFINDSKIVANTIKLLKPTCNYLAFLCSALKLKF